MTDAVNRTFCGVDLRASTEACKVGEPGTDRVDDVDSGVEIPEVILSPEWTRSMVARLYPSKKLRTFLCFYFWQSVTMVKWKMVQWPQTMATFADPDRSVQFTSMYV